MALKKLAKNAAWLGALQLLSYALPLITLPIVTRAFGVELYGELAVIQAYTAYAGLIVTFGFSIIGPRRVAQAHGDHVLISSVFSAVFYGQCVLCVVCAIGYIIAANLLPILHESLSIGALLLIQAMITSISPDWVFLGMERVDLGARRQAIMRILATVLIVIFVRDREDAMVYVGINTVSAFVLLLLMIDLLRREGIHLVLCSRAEISKAIASGAGLFVSTLSINIYTTTTVIIVRLALGPDAAGSFALAERVRAAVMGIYTPISTALYPFLCRTAGFVSSAEERWIKCMFFRTIILTAAGMSIGLFFGAPWIMNFLGGAQFSQSALVLQIMAATPLIIAMSNILGVQTMLPSGMERELNLVLASAGGLGLILTYSFARSFGLAGAATSFLLIECFVTVAFALIVAQKISLKTLFFIDTPRVAENAE